MRSFEYLWRRYLTLISSSLSLLSIGALAFGRPFGMVASGVDSAIVGGDADKPQTVPAIRVLNERGDVSATLGCLPPWMR